jgi:hypothetical protein
VTEYAVTALAPIVTGAVHETVADPSPATALTEVGGPGRREGVTAFDGDEATPVAIPLRASTANVYGVPSVSPETIALLAPATAGTVELPGETTTV